MSRRLLLVRYARPGTLDVIDVDHAYPTGRNGIEPR